MFSPKEKIFTIGSCFARHIERSLRNRGFVVPSMYFTVPEKELFGKTANQAGILNKYTPCSMLNEVRFAFGDTDGSEYLIQIDDDSYIDGQLHTDAGVTLKRGLERRAEIRALYKNAIPSSKVVIVTLGLVEAWWDEVSQVYLNETPSKAVLTRHKNRLFFEVLSPENVITVVDELIVTLKQHGHPEQRVFLTVSPVPIGRSYSGKDAIIANSYSKSILRVAAEVAVQKYEWVDYYPSFESVTHSDRTLAWADDLIHVRQEVVDANVLRLIHAYSGDAKKLS
jgi:hypothetical protein